MIFYIKLMILISSLVGNSDSLKKMQSDIYHATFSDTSNFRLTRLMNQTIPDKFFIMDTTELWYSKRFWLEDFDSLPKERFIARVKNDEHHPYYHTFLFSNPTLDSLINDNEKKSLAYRSQQIVKEKIKLNSEKYKTISTAKNIKGFYFVVTQPLFSSDYKYAFVDMTVYSNNEIFRGQQKYFAHICLTFEKQNDKWIKLNQKNWLIL